MVSGVPITITSLHVKSLRRRTTERRALGVHMTIVTKYHSVYKHKQKSPREGAIFVSADAEECPGSRKFAEAKVSLTVAHGERATTEFTTTDTDTRVDEIEGTTLPFHSLRIRVQAAVETECRDNYWTVNYVLKGTVHSILSYA